MTKAELISAVAKEAGVTKSEAKRCVDAGIKALSEALLKGERIALPGLGVFSVKERKARKGRNPRTGEEMTIPAKKIVVFKPGKQLREELNK